MNIGIDLGTTFSAAAYITNGEPKIIINSEGKNSTPSVVLIDDDKIEVGSSAKDQLIIAPERIVSTVKDFMGTDKKFQIDGRNYSPEDISAFILKKIILDAQEFIGENVENVVVTIPAYFTDAQRVATQDACEIAGINLKAMINEPTAAALCYLNDKGCENSNILVYDLGGGTFDVTILSFKDGKSSVVATNGIKKLGGHFFDQLIVNYVCDCILENSNIDLYDDEYLDILQELSIKAESAKIKLSTSTKADIILRIGKVKEKITITRDYFEKLIEKFYKRTESVMQLALSDAEMEFKDIDKIVMVGGSSRIPYIRQNIQKISGIEPSSDINPDEVVAMGAALYANDSELEITDVCSHSLGIVSYDKSSKKLVNSIIIKRNSPIPIKSIKSFQFARGADPTISITLTEGEFADLEYVETFEIEKIVVPDNTKNGTEVIIEFDLDKNQIIHISVIIKTEPKYIKELSIDRKSNLTDEEKKLKKSALIETNFQ